jgi:hypothetical protein
VVRKLYRSRFERALRGARLDEVVALDKAVRECGISRPMLARYLSGEQVPLLWIARALAGALGHEAVDLWPELAPAPPRKATVRAPWRLVKR